MKHKHDTRMKMLTTVLLLLLSLAVTLSGCAEAEQNDTPKANLPAESVKIEQEIISAYAKQYGKDENKLSVRIVAEYGDVYAVYVDEDGFAYEDEMIEEVVHFTPSAIPIRKR